MSDTPIKESINVPRGFNPSDGARLVPPGMGELNYIQTLLAGLIDQTLYTTSSPTFAGLTISGLTASQLVGTDVNKLLQSVSPGTSLSLSGTTLNTIQGIRTADSPVFTGLYLTAAAWIKAILTTTGTTGLARLGSDNQGLNFTTNALWNGSAWTRDDTGNPSFAIIQHMGNAQMEFRVAAAASGNITWLTPLAILAGGEVRASGANFPVLSAIRTSSETVTLRAASSIQHRTTGNMADGFGAGFLLQIRDGAGVDNNIAGFYGVRAGADNTGDLWLYTALAGVAVYPLIAKSSGLVNITANVGLGIADSNLSHYLRLVCGSDLAADRNLTFTTGDAARTITLSGNPTLADWFDQAVKAASSPTFAGFTVDAANPNVLISGTGNRSDYVQLSLLQDGSSAIRWGGYFLIDATTSDFHWRTRNDNVDYTTFTILNAYPFYTGVGLATPLSKLHVKNPSGNSNDDIIISNWNDTVLAGFGLDKVVTNDLLISALSAIRIYTNSAITPGSTPTNEVLRIDTSGKVGIGTMAAAAKLAINGGLHVGGDSDPGDNNLLVDGTGVVTGAFGCNGATGQTAYASGGAITPGAGAFGADSAANFAAMVTLVQNIRAALIANGIMS